MGDRSFSPAQARERTSARRGPLRVTAPVVAARTGSARKSIANSRLEGQGGPGEATVHPPDLCKVLGSTWWLEACLTALAVKRPRPGLRRPDGRLRGGGARAPSCSSIARAKQSGP